MHTSEQSSRRRRVVLGWTGRRAWGAAIFGVMAVAVPIGAGSGLGLGLTSGADRRPAASAAVEQAATAPATDDVSAAGTAASPSPAAAAPATTAATKAKAQPVTAAAAAKCTRASAATSKVRVTTVKTGVKVTGYGGEGDTEKLPMAIAATPSGQSWLAWLGTNGKVYLGRLGCNDKLVGKPTAFTGVDLQDVQADRTGGVLLLTRKGACKTGPLCGGESSPCRTMWMVRFDTKGKLVWQRQVTNLTSTRGGYSNGARFVWWYQHHGRLASDGKNYAAVFGTAITVKNGNCVDIHQGDRLQVVNSSGKLVNHAASSDFGCSHAWNSRVVWDPRTKKFVAVCATDNGCRIAQPNPYRTVVAGKCDGTLFGGDLVLARTKGYWTAWSQGGKVRLAHFTTGAADKKITTSISSKHPHLARYGNRMLLSWQSGTAMRARAYNASTGKAVGAAFKVNVRDHDYQALKSYADGSVAYPAAGSTTTSIKVARIMPRS